MKGIIGRLIFVGIVALGAYVLNDRLSGSPRSLAVGDCFNLPAAETVRQVPCNGAHDAEVVLVVDHPLTPNGAPLAAGELDRFVLDTCGGAMIEYVGGLESVEANAALQGLDLGVIHPTREDWNIGKPQLTCYVRSVNGSQLTKSYKAPS